MILEKFNKNQYYYILGEFYRILLPGTYQLSVLYNCQQVYTTNFTITNLLEFNITLTNDLFSIYNTYNLNKYAVFCSPNKQPAPCSNSYTTKISKTSIATTMPTTVTKIVTTTKMPTTTTKELTTTSKKITTTTKKLTTTSKKITTTSKKRLFFG